MKGWLLIETLLVLRAANAKPNPNGHAYGYPTARNHPQSALGPRLAQRFLERRRLHP